MSEHDEHHLILGQHEDCGGIVHMKEWEDPSPLRCLTGPVEGECTVCQQTAVWPDDMEEEE